ncbi:hypothetical protein HMPREF2753_03865 [Neisseria sp. HMSC071C03]|nr:hypothetical protein HMPREF3054_03950 [Neisseria sp. HMSC071B12]OHR48155.1 hypothetical protein HMPREF2753_03865 [Neisseria sp. HMSC071C03]
MSSNSVIPAQAGIQNVKLKKPFLPDKFLCRQLWIPACTGMTTKIFLFEIYYKRSSENRFSGFQTTFAFFLRLIF